MTGRIVDIRNRPAILYDFYGARRGTPEFDAAKWLNERTGSEDPERFVRSQSEEGYIDEIRSAGIAFAVVIGRGTLAITSDNDRIASLVSKRPELVGVGSVDPGRVGAKAAVDEAERAVKILNLRAINLEPGFGAPARHFDDPVFHQLYEAL
jgi:predicted TIM-barrel fold metal-dependent hydrolase